jgi:hypothetical protein
MTFDPSTQTSRPPVAGVFKNRQDAERAFETITRRGYAPRDAHFIMSEDARKKHWPTTETKDKGDKALEGAGAGGGIGAAVGGTAAAIAAIGTTLALPGLGLVIAGPLAAGLAGAGAGGVTGGILGALVGAGVPEDKARRYDEEIRRGNVVVGVNPRTDEDAQYFEKEWSGSWPETRQ